MASKTASGKQSRSSASTGSRARQMSGGGGVGTSSGGLLPNRSPSGASIASAATSSAVTSIASGSDIGRQNNGLCMYLHRFCLRPRLEGYKYCIQHILCDRIAPYKQCSYTHPQTNKRCPRAARRFDRRERDTTYCQWHIKRFNLLRRKNVVTDRAKTILEQQYNRNGLKRTFDRLEHFCPSIGHKHRRYDPDWEIDDDGFVTPTQILRDKVKDAFTVSQYMLQCELESTNLKLADVLKEGVQSRPDIMRDQLDSTYDNVEFQNDALRNAAFYTPEELARAYRDKMVHLQKLYIQMLGYYRYILKKRLRDNYLGKSLPSATASAVLTTGTAMMAPGIAIEPEPDDKIDLRDVNPLKEQEDYRLLKAMYRYHNPTGVQKIYQDMFSDIRQKALEQYNHKKKQTDTEPEPEIKTEMDTDTDVTETKEPIETPTCIWKNNKNSEKCNNQCLPLSYYCREHILYDPHQVLFRPCAGGDPPCLVPTISYVHKNRCINHYEFKYSFDELEKMLKSPQSRIKMRAKEMDDYDEFDDDDDDVDVDVEHDGTDDDNCGGDGTSNNEEPGADNNDMARRTNEIKTTNETEKFNTVDDISLGMDSEHENLFNLEQFDLESNILP